MGFIALDDCRITDVTVLEKKQPQAGIDVFSFSTNRHYFLMAKDEVERKEWADTLRAMQSEPPAPPVPPPPLHPFPPSPSSLTYSHLFAFFRWQGKFCLFLVPLLKVSSYWLLMPPIPPMASNWYPIGQVCPCP